MNHLDISWWDWYIYIYRLNRQQNRLPRHIACDGFLGFLPKLCLQPGWARDARDPEAHSGGWTISWRWIVYYSLVYGYMTCMTYMTYILYIYIWHTWRVHEWIWMIHSWFMAVQNDPNRHQSHQSRPGDGRLALTARAGDEWILLQEMGYPNSWMVYFMKNPPINGWFKGYTHFRTPPHLHICSCNSSQKNNLIDTRNLQVILASTVFMKYHAALWNEISNEANRVRVFSLWKNPWQSPIHHKPDYY